MRLISDVCRWGVCWFNIFSPVTLERHSKSQFGGKWHVWIKINRTVCWPSKIRDKVTLAFAVCTYRGLQCFLDWMHHKPQRCCLTKQRLNAYQLWLHHAWIQISLAGNQWWFQVRAIYFVPPFRTVCQTWWLPALCPAPPVNCVNIFKCKREAQQSCTSLCVVFARTWCLGCGD